MTNQVLIDKIFAQAKAAGWSRIQLSDTKPIGGDHQVRATHKTGFRRDYFMLRLAVPTQQSYMQWLIRCADELEYTAVPVPGQDLTPKPFFTGWHYPQPA